MKIPWAVFGERNGGHALLASSSNTEFAARITQYTDRPGDPPLGLEWGPVISGFYFADHYILLRTLPDATAGRAGMVRSYAAFLPASQLGAFGNLAVVFKELPSDLSKFHALLPPINIEEKALQTMQAGPDLPGFAYIARQLCSSEPMLPLVWTSIDSYLPTVDAVWAKLPVGLRTAFAFSFQFAPEHKIPVAPTIVATLPALAARWPTKQIIPIEQQSLSPLNTAQKWFAGLADGVEFNEVLQDFDMVVREFKELNILSSFADLIVRLPHLSFAEARKAVRILEKYSRPMKTSAKKRAPLFNKMCALVLESSAEDMETLRNFDPEALADLIPSLQDSMRKWIRSSVAVVDSPASHVRMLELAVADPETWWSAPFVEWLRALATSLTMPESHIFCRIVFASNALTDFLLTSLLPDSATEEKILAGIPAVLSRSQSEIILKLSEQRDWMRMHATCALRTLPKAEAVALHAKVVGQSTAGLDLLYQVLGFESLLQVACGLNNVALTQYVGRRLQDNVIHVPNNLGASCAHWPSLLTHAVRHGGGGLTGRLRELVIATLTAESTDTQGSQALLDACCARDISIFLALAKPSACLDKLGTSPKTEALSKINEFVLDEIRAGRKIELTDRDSFRGLLDVSSILNALRTIPVSRAVAGGVNAFRSLAFLTDFECSRWLIDLFTRTQFDPLDAKAAAEIASLLISGDYPLSAKIVRDTAEQYGRRDVAPILDSIRNKYLMTREFSVQTKPRDSRLPQVLIATALHLERNEVMRHLGAAEYRPDLYADIAYWPVDQPVFEIFVLATGAGNLDAQRATLRVLVHVKPKFAFFLGVSGGIKDSDVGDVVYGTKVYYTEGGKEESDGMRARPITEQTSEALVQLAHRVAMTDWQPANQSTEAKKPKATPAVIASGEKVLASTSPTAANYQRLKTGFNDTQVVDMEAFGFLTAVREHEIRHRMIIRGVSDTIEGKTESDAKGNQPLAAQNAAAFLFALLRSCPDLLPPKRRKILGFF